MQINLPEALVEAIGFEKLKEFGVTQDSLTWKRYIELELSRLTIEQIKKIQALCKPFAEIRGTKVVLKDIETWLSACDKAGVVKARKLEHFEDLLIEYLLHVAGHRLFKKHDKDGEAWLCYYVAEIEFHPEYKTRDETRPAYVEFTYFYERYGSRFRGRCTFYLDDIRGKTVEEALAHQGFYAESSEMRENYLKEIKKYRELVPQIGIQYLVNGIGTDDVPDKKESDSFNRRNPSLFRFVDGQNRNRVVIDIFREDDENERETHYDLREYFWHDKVRCFARRGGNKEDDPTETLEHTSLHYSGKREGIPVEDIVEEPPQIEIPIHPFLIVFDLQKHLRLSVHVNYLKKYEYDTHLSEKLILPDEIKSLIKMLVEHKSTSFKDIVAGKSGGAIILLTGAAGVGKTLTAEVFAEAEQKPLYSVQASQLGIRPEELERELLLILKRAARWNAVMLIDEADVYVHERGNDLQQNAIVGVFLRVLEYHASVLFLTTNRPELVDDAIASRCVARIDYPYPTPEDQHKIWTVLSESSNIKIQDSVISEFVGAHKKISGRDVKNLLKLAQLISLEDKKEITADMLEFALKFKPTVDAKTT